MPASFDGKLVLAISPAPEKKTATARVAVELVEAAGQPVRPFRDGLDYAFILYQDAERVIRPEQRRILVRARPEASARL